MKPNAFGRPWIYALTALSVVSSFSAIGAEIEGQVLGAGAPIARSAVTLWSAGADAPRQLAQAQTGDDGRFTLSLSKPERSGRDLLPRREGRRADRAPGR